jgi:hypothetical protein
MPTAIAAIRTFVAAELGPALTGLGGALCVHSVFARAINLRVEGADLLVTLCPPGGGLLPQAIGLRDAVDFLSWELAVGTRGRLGEDCLVLGNGRLRVDLRGAKRLPREPLPPLRVMGWAWEACVEGLATIQADRGCELSLAAVLGRSAARGAMGERLAASARALGEDLAGRAAARRGAVGAEGEVATTASGRDEESRAGLAAAVARLVGAGQGLTPSGDDYLCGLMAAAACAATDGSGEGLLPVLAEAVETSIGSTNEISASMLRCAGRGLFSPPLAAAAWALAEDDSAGALRCIFRLAGLGHSSGADIATGLLHGLGLFAVFAAKGQGPFAKV